MEETLKNEDTKKLSLVEASFVEEHLMTCDELFDGFDEIIAVTYSSGLEFMSGILKESFHGIKSRNRISMKEE